MKIGNPKDGQNKAGTLEVIGQLTMIIGIHLRGIQDYARQPEVGKRVNNAVIGIHLRGRYPGICQTTRSGKKSE